MSIIIQNMSPVRGIPYGKGRQEYVLRINNKVIAEFDHNFEDGLAVCLEKAAKAARDPNRREVTDEQEEIKAIMRACGSWDRP